MQMYGPLPQDVAKELDTQLARADRAHEKYPRMYPRRYGAICQYRDDIATQVAYSALFAPQQVEYWAWVWVGLDREVKHEIELAGLAEREAAA